MQHSVPTITFYFLPFVHDYHGNYFGYAWSVLGNYLHYVHLNHAALLRQVKQMSVQSLVSCSQDKIM